MRDPILDTVVAWHMHGECMACARGEHGMCTGSAWHVHGVEGFVLAGILNMWCFQPVCISGPGKDLN